MMQFVRLLLVALVVVALAVGSTVQPAAAAEVITPVGPALGISDSDTPPGAYSQFNTNTGATILMAGYTAPANGYLRTLRFRAGIANPDPSYDDAVNVLVTATVGSVVLTSATAAEFTISSGPRSGGVFASWNNGEDVTIVFRQLNLQVNQVRQRQTQTRSAQNREEEEREEEKEERERERGRREDTDIERSPQLFSHERACMLLILLAVSFFVSVRVNPSHSPGSTRPTRLMAPPLANARTPPAGIACPLPP
jgi:hypothetical protein